MARESSAVRIHRLLAEGEQAESISAFCAEQGLDERRFREWRRQYGGMSAAAIAREQRRFLPAIGVFAAALVALAVWQWPALAPTVQALVLGTGELEVQSDPPGAVVVVGGIERGKTPVTIRELTAGEHFVQVQHPFRKNEEFLVDVARDEQLQRAVTLGAATGALHLVSNPKGAWIDLDGERLSERTPLLLEGFSAGIHTVRMGMDERRSALQEVHVLADERAEVLVELDRIPMGMLRVALSPANATVEVVGVDQPFKQGMRLAIGDYEVRVSGRGYAAQTVPAKVHFERETKLSVALTRHRGTLELTLSPPSAEVVLTVGGKPTPYRRGMSLPTGRVGIVATAMGHRTARQSLSINSGANRHRVRLNRINAQAGARVQDRLAVGAMGPELIVIAAGEFVMGAADGGLSERPAHTVRVLQPFALGVYEVTREQFEDYASATGVATPWTDGPSRLPATGLSHAQVARYITWLSAQTGEHYRLPSEAEWEYAARAGSTGKFFFGNDEAQLCQYANIVDLAAKKVFRSWQTIDCNDGFVRLSPVGGYAPNPLGLYDIYGNAEEIVADCYMDDYVGAPTDGSARGGPMNCSRAIRGGSWDSRADTANSYSRRSGQDKNDDRGFRLARDL